MDNSITETQTCAIESGQYEWTANRPLIGQVVTVSGWCQITIVRDSVCKYIYFVYLGLCWSNHSVRLYKDCKLVWKLLEYIVDNVSGFASCQVWEAGSGHCGESSKHLRKLRVGTLSVNTLRGRVCKVVETLSRRKVDVCCIQETRYRGGNCRTIKGKDTRYKLYWSGNDKGTAGVGAFVAEEWIEKVFEV